MPYLTKGLEIRPVDREDLSVWASLRNKLWPDSITIHEAELADYFNGNSIDIVQAYVLQLGEAEIIGFIELNLRNFAEGSRASRVPYIEGWYVGEEFQGQGYGKLLIMSAEKWAKEQGYSELASDTELENRKSIQIHKHLGFKETERVACFLKKL